MPNPNQSLVLIAEDDLKTSNLLSVYLKREGFETVAAYDGRCALEVYTARRPQFIILDVMLPQMDGWEVCREIRRNSDVPMLFLTARDEESDRLLGLGLGADDYVVKPFSPKEVVARVKGIMRRTVRSLRPKSGRLTSGPLVLDLEKRLITLHGAILSLTPTEYTLLATLMAAPGRAFTRDELLSRLYPRGEAVVGRVVDVHIGKLRAKIERDPAAPEYIVTARGIGYRFAPRQEGST